ncbi:hypothetical protein WEI85_42680 [Actinomycetes bacterium KLBMP 9797]
MVTRWWKRSCLILVAVLGASLMTAVAAAAATELKLMTWNARTQGASWSSVAEHIFDSGADVVALQEVCDSTLDNVEATLESDTGMP